MAGDYKVQCRLENVEMSVLMVRVDEATELASSSISFDGSTVVSSGSPHLAEPATSTSGLATCGGGGVNYDTIGTPMATGAHSGAVGASASLARAYELSMGTSAGKERKKRSKGGGKSARKSVPKTSRTVSSDGPSSTKVAATDRATAAAASSIPFPATSTPARGTPMPAMKAGKAKPSTTRKARIAS